jgi:hypothetical protein
MTTQVPVLMFGLGARTRKPRSLSLEAGLLRRWPKPAPNFAESRPWLPKALAPYRSSRCLSGWRQISRLTNSSVDPVACSPNHLQRSGQPSGHPQRWPSPANAHTQWTQASWGEGKGPSPPPILFDLTLHSRRLRVLELEPCPKNKGVLRATSDIGHI